MQGQDLLVDVLRVALPAHRCRRGWHPLGAPPSGNNRLPASGHTGARPHKHGLLPSAGRRAGDGLYRGVFGIWRGDVNDACDVTVRRFDPLGAAAERREMATERASSLVF